MSARERPSCASHNALDCKYPFLYVEQENMKHAPIKSKISATILCPFSFILKIEGAEFNSFNSVILQGWKRYLYNINSTVKIPKPFFFCWDFSKINI